MISLNYFFVGFKSEVEKSSDEGNIYSLWKSQWLQRTIRPLSVFVKPCNYFPILFGVWIGRDSIKLEPAKFSCNGQKVNVLGVVGPAVSVRAARLPCEAPQGF